MKYTIKYSLPYDIYRYKMHAEDEQQLITFLKMLVDEQAYGFEVVQSTQQRGNEMEDNKILITWKTKLDDGYIDKRQIECKSKTSAKILHNRLSKQDKTVSIEMECLTNE